MKAILAGKDTNLQIECAVVDQVRDMTLHVMMRSWRLVPCIFHGPGQ